ncbi:MAG: hypothetical protein HQK55_02310 [Deltaproteobacteria bacterium]|nr:hypothetical protein [Deltaproteobacteria bacterium]
MKDMTLKKALKLWEMNTPIVNEHLTATDLKCVREGKGRDDFFAHLAVCNRCRQMLWDLQDLSIVQHEADDYVIPLAAADGIPQEATWITADEKYRIEIRRILADTTQRAALIVRAQRPFNFVGKTITVRDASQRIILQGRISEEGKVAAIVDDIGSLVLKKITITED